MSSAKSVLVTGADGFIGSHLTEELVRRGFKTRALVQYNSFGSWGWLDDSEHSSDIEIIAGDVRDPRVCNEITKNIDTVFHLAALIAIPYSYLAPNSYVDTNVSGTLNMCQASLENGVQRVMHTSTSEVYGTANYVPIDEKHPLQPQSPYSASKIGADAIAYSFFSSFDLPVTTVRPFNTYGPRQSARALIPTVITQIASGSASIKLGDVSPTRDFNYVSDTVGGFIALSEEDAAKGETVNIGSNSEISIGDTVMLIKELMGREVEIVTEEARLRPEKSEVFRLWCGNEKAQSLIGYQPAVSLEEGLCRTIEWIQIPSNLSRYKSDIYNV